MPVVAHVIRLKYIMVVMSVVLDLLCLRVLRELCLCWSFIRVTYPRLFAYKFGQLIYRDPQGNR